MSEETNLDSTTSGETSTAGIAVSGEVIAAPVGDFLGDLPEDIRSEPSLANIKDKTSLAKSYVHAQRELGSRIRIPGEDASAEVKAEFYNKVTSIPGVVKLPDPNDAKAIDEFQMKLGRPRTADEYAVDLGENIPVDPNMASEFKQLAFRLGLSKDQAAELVRYEAARTQAQIQTLTVSKAKTVELLKSSWGNEFENRLNLSKETLAHFEQKYPEAVTELRETPMGNNPVVLMALAELGKAYKESGTLQGTRITNYGLTPDEAQARIAEVQGNPELMKAYLDDSHPNHKAVVEKMNQYHLAAYPEQGQS